MRLIGRLILILIGIASVVISVIYIIDAWKALNASGWHDIGKYPDKIVYLVAIILNFITVLFGLGSIMCAFRRKMSFKWLLFSLIVIAIGIYHIVTYNVYPDFQNQQYLMMIITSFVIPGGYIVGCMLMCL